MASTQTPSGAVADYIAKSQTSKSQSLQSSTQNGTLKITNLPTEMLLHITDFLKDYRTACFILSCREIYNKLGTEAFERIPKAQPLDSYPVDLSSDNYNPRQRSHKSRELFLRYLQRDLPDVIYCYYCDKLHEPSDPMDVDSRHANRACIQVENPKGKHACESYINFSGVQMLMKRWRTGYDCTAQLQGMIRTCNVYRAGWSRQTTVVPRIAACSFMTRTQSWILIEQDTPSFEVELCQHFHGNERWGGHVAQLIKCRMSHSDNLACEDCIKLRQCSKCDTDFCIDVQRLEAGRTSIRFTVWRNMGLCRSPFNSFWQNHRAYSAVDRDLNAPEIRDTFEAADQNEPYRTTRPDDSLRILPHQTPCWCQDMNKEECLSPCEVEHPFPCTVQHSTGKHMGIKEASPS